MRRKLTASVLATAVLAGGALTGVAAAAPAHHSSRAEARSLDRHSLKHERQSRDLRSHESLRDR